jgi:hypothetical protein
MEEFSISSDSREVKSTFSLDYMDDMSKVISDKGKVTLRFGMDYPCMITGMFADGYGIVEYLLAPRVEDY